MNKLIYILIATTFIVASACNKKLDVTPQQNITPEQIKTADDVKGVLFGGYKLLQNGSAFGEQYLLIADLLASEKQVKFVGTFTEYRDIEDKNQNQTSFIPRDMWSNAYAIINSMNTVLDKLDLIDESERDDIKSEAEFIRGIVYFELVNFFAKPYSAGDTENNLGVPLVLDPQKYVYDPSTAFVARASVQDVYNQVISDLSDAATNLPPQQEDFRATQFSAKAFLSRVYLNMGMYQDAATMANNVIQSGEFSLVSTYNQAFNNVGNSSEDIFAIQQTAQSNAGTGNSGLTTFYSAYPVGRGDVQIVNSYLNIFTADDFRKNFWYQGGSIGGFTGKYTGKWKDFYKTVPVVRLAEMYLTRGEANLRKGGAPVGGLTPLSDINTVRQRSSTSALATVTAQNFVDERFRELGFEGDRVWTLKRLQMNVDGYEYTYDKLILPIPQREIDVNKNLVQNPGY